MAITPSPSRTTHAAMSHPEPEERRKATYRQIDLDLRDRLEEYRDMEGLNNGQLSKRLGYPDNTAVSKFLNNKFDRDPQDIHDRIVSILNGEARRQIDSGEIIETSVTRQTCDFFDRVVATNTVGVLHSAAGLGKSTGIGEYRKGHPTAIAVTVNDSQNDAKGVRQLLWEALDHCGYKHGQSRWNFLVEKVVGSGRLIIFDNAETLTFQGRRHAFHFRDATGCPLVFAGNREILDNIAQNGQQHSRTFMEHEAVLDDIPTVVKTLVDQHTDDGAAIYDLAARVVKKVDGGHLRALVNNLKSMREFLRDEPIGGDTRLAFRSALAKSIHHKN